MREGRSEGGREGGRGGRDGVTLFRAGVRPDALPRKQFTCEVIALYFSFVCSNARYFSFFFFFGVCSRERLFEP